MKLIDDDEKTIEIFKIYKNKIDMEKVNLDGIRLYLKYLREEFFNVLIQQDIDLIDLSQLSSPPARTFVSF